MNPSSGPVPARSYRLGRKSPDPRPARDYKSKASFGCVPRCFAAEQPKSTGACIHESIGNSISALHLLSFPSLSRSLTSPIAIPVQFRFFFLSRSSPRLVSFRAISKAPSLSCRISPLNLSLASSSAFVSLLSA